MERGWVLLAADEVQGEPWHSAGCSRQTAGCSRAAAGRLQSQEEPGVPCVSLFITLMPVAGDLFVSLLARTGRCKMGSARASGASAASGCSWQWHRTVCLCFESGILVAMLCKDCSMMC